MLEEKAELLSPIRKPEGLTNDTISRHANGFGREKAANKIG
jgi:hypothetical protein